MVKIIELSSREVKRRARISKLVEVTKDVLPGSYIPCIPADSREGWGFSVYPHGKESSEYLFISTFSGNDIKVKDPSLLDDAVKLAKRYEEVDTFLFGLISRKYTVKKDYEEITLEERA